MAVYNSFVPSNQDDSDITIINPSIMHEHNDKHVPTITLLQQANHLSESRQKNDYHVNNNMNQCKTSDDKHDYIFVDHNSQEHAKQLEKVLIFYIRDLKQETKTQLDCDQQFITRLMNIIRLAYPIDQQKMIELDKIMADIASLHDKRHVENNEEIEKLRTEICQLNKMLCATTNEQSMCIESNENSMINDSMSDYNQWTNIEVDTEKLQEIVQLQKDQINETMTLISQTVTASASLNVADISIINSEATVDDKPTPPPASSRTNSISTLLQKIQDIAGQQPSMTSSNLNTADISIINSEATVADKQTPPTASPHTNSISTLLQKIQQIAIQQPSTTVSTSLHAVDIPIVNSEATVTNKQILPSVSPHTNIISTLVKKIHDITGQRSQQSSTTAAVSQEITLQNLPISTVPAQSSAILTLSSSQILQNQAPPTHKEEQPVHKEPHEPMDIPLASVTEAESKKCPVCNHEFSSTFNNMEIYAHIENCLSTPNIIIEPTDYVCPNCNRKLPGNDESAYLQHLSDCYNRDM